MLKAITNNPYRILGVYADATESDIVAAADRLLSAPNSICEADFNIEGLSKPSRDPATISVARRMILDNDSALFYKLFWFIRPLDEACINYLKTGKLTDARRKLAFNTRIDSKHNLMVCCLIEGMYDHVARIAYELIFKQDYRQTVLLTKMPFIGVINGFKDKLFDASNNSSVPVGLTMSWKQYLQDSILNSIYNTINTRYLQPAKHIIKKDIPSTYREALSTLIQSYRNRYLQALQYFADNADSRYKRFMKEITNSAQEWIEGYLLYSQDVLKHRAVTSEAITFSMFSPVKMQNSYLRLIGISLQDTAAFLMSDDICERIISTANKLYHFYSEGNVSLKSFRSLLEQSAYSLNEVQSALGPSNSCYVGLANLTAEIGLEIVGRELEGILTYQIVADSSSILRHIDRIIDKKHLYDRNREKRDFCMKRLGTFGLSSTIVNPQQGIGSERRQTDRTTTRSTGSSRNYSSLHPTKKDSSLVKASSVYRFILFALIIELLFGLLLGNTAMLSVGLVLAFSYILGVFLAEKSFDKDAKKLVCIYVITQAVVSIVGFLVI